MEYVFDEKVSTPLCEIMGRHGSDKGSVHIQKSWHNYTTVYYSLFKDIKDKPLRVFELGLGTNNVNIPSNMGPNGKPGASLYGWKEFFPNAAIFGADIDSNILFNTDRIKTYYCDQTKPEAIRSLWSASDLSEGFDIIIDDGLHTYDANVCFFENSIHKLKPGGFFIIEDVAVNYLSSFENKISTYKSTYPHLTFMMLKIPSISNHHDNNIIVVHKQV